MAEKIYKIKPLEWNVEYNSTWRKSHTTFGSYGIDGELNTFLDDGIGTLIIKDGCSSLESAKLACQEHYQQRLLASLEEVDVLDRVKEFASKKITEAETVFSEINEQLTIPTEYQENDGYEPYDEGYYSAQKFFAQQILTILNKEVKE